LALFPLIALETILLSAPVILLTVLLPVYTGEFIWTESASQTWIMGLLLGVSVLSGMIQTYYMEALLRRADHDPLTDAITRRSGVEIIEFLFRLSIDKEAHLSLAFVDLDHFKSLNDNYGHDAGDEALKQVVHTLNKMLREADTVIRWGGEEFVLVLPETPMDGAKLVMDRIVSNWFATRPDGQPLTASIGVAELQNDSIQTWEELVELADKRMYTAKESGRAQYVCT
jgi:diguanylate cyclase (GGDEF)-like protein